MAATNGGRPTPPPAFLFTAIPAPGTPGGPITFYDTDELTTQTAARVQALLDEPLALAVVTDVATAHVVAIITDYGTCITDPAMNVRLRRAMTAWMN